MNPVSVKVVALAAVLLFFVATPHGRPQDDKPISGAGCVQPGVEAGCVVLRDAKTNTLYNLYFSGKRPETGTGIHFEGTRLGGVTSCMQGEAIKVTEWSQVKMSCSAEGNEDK